MTKRTRKHVTWSVGAIVGVALLSVLFMAAPMHGVQTDADLIPTARVLEGDVPVVVHATGELRPVRSAGLVAPSVGGPMQILRIMGTGTPVKEGDVVVEFDTAEQEEKLAQAVSAVAQAEQEIAKMRADVVVQRAEQQV